MTMEALFEAIYKQLPELKDKLRINLVQYDDTKNRAVFFFHADVLVERASYGVIKGILQNAFPKLRAALRAAVAAGAVDGLTGKSEYSIDMLGEAIHCALLGLMGAVLACATSQA